MTIGTFTLIKNEIGFIAYHILSFIDHLDEMVFYDGNSTDGTLEAIKHIQKTHKRGGIIRLYEGKDCPDLRQGYVDLFNELLGQCKTDYTAFMHPDMIPVNPQVLKTARQWDALCYSTGIRSFCHDMHTEITRGRRKWWKMWHRTVLGLHYHGYYGANDEDLYFKDITGPSYAVLPEPEYYPFEIRESGLMINHYCEVKDYNRRLEKMVRSIKNQGIRLDDKQVTELAKQHPRVTLESGDSPFGVFEFERVSDPLPAIFLDKTAQKIASRFSKEPVKCLI